MAAHSMVSALNYGRGCKDLESMMIYLYHPSPIRCLTSPTESGLFNSPSVKYVHPGSFPQAYNLWQFYH